MAVLDAGERGLTIALEGRAPGREEHAGRLRHRRPAERFGCEHDGFARSAHALDGENADVRGAVEIRLDGPLVVATRPIRLRDARPHGRIDASRAFVRGHRLVEQPAVSAGVDETREQLRVVRGRRLPQEPDHRVLRPAEIGLEVRVQAVGLRQVRVQLERACEGALSPAPSNAPGPRCRTCRSPGRPVPAAPTPARSLDLRRPTAGTGPARYGGAAHRN